MNVFECVNIVNDYSISVQWICYTVIVYTFMCDKCVNIVNDYSVNSGVYNII